MISCAHHATMRPAFNVLHSTKVFMLYTLTGKIKLHRQDMRHGIQYDEYVQPGERYKLACPEKLILEAREQLEQQ